MESSTKKKKKKNVRHRGSKRKKEGGSGGSKMINRIGMEVSNKEKEVGGGGLGVRKIKGREVGLALVVLTAGSGRAAPATVESVQCFGRKKTAVAVTHCKRGRGLIKINGVPIELVQPEILRYKAFEPILLLGRQRFAGVDMRIRVKGGGHTSQIYAIRQSIAKALVAFYQKYVDEQTKKEIKDILIRYDRTLLVADPRRCEPKKFGGRGARSRFQKSYR
ncbi:hypothetical protein H5410_025955 [Solanum commersonii]|uniref:40S ribosomal protein S16 n=1 Tax=Solanum commersonii TaxID=4109 RepID=A0A9J5YXI7_SOLCO|nr:hypothetical protein H5410_025955 [Solanum commersonii]